MEQPKSIKIPNIVVARAVEKTINDPVKALIDPRYLTPYNSAKVDDPKILAKPLDIPTKPKNTKAVIGALK